MSNTASSCSSAPGISFRTSSTRGSTTIWKSPTRSSRIRNWRFSIKHTALDFWRHVKVNECLTRGKHPQIIEVQCQREYEGKGAYPNYVMDGVINGFEENRSEDRAEGFVGRSEDSRRVFMVARRRLVWALHQERTVAGPERLRAGAVCERSFARARKRFSASMLPKDSELSGDDIGAFPRAVPAFRARHSQGPPLCGVRLRCSTSPFCRRPAGCATTGSAGGSNCIWF